MKLRIKTGKELNSLLYILRKSSSSSTSTATAVNNPETDNKNRETLSIKNLRENIAPWIRIGDFKQGLLSHLSTLEILRALFVLRTCSIDFFVDRSFQLFELSQKFGPLGSWTLRKTFFNQFVGGETIPRMTEVVQSMHKRGLTLMVAPVLEEDVEHSKSSRNTYDDNLQTLLNLAEMTNSMDKQSPILQLKMTAIMPATTLEQVSREIGCRIDPKTGALPAKVVTEIANCVENPEALQFKNLNESDRSHFMDGFRRADSLVKKAEQLGVYVLVDAEFYSCKLAISSMALALMARYNRRGHIVGNTIQGYLKDALPTIKAELPLISQQIGVNWYGKIVRGAYVDRERYLASKKDKKSPICDSYEETSTSYDNCITQVLNHLTQTKGSHLLVASHNEKSIRLAAQRMKDQDIAPQSVSFAQIYGMADYLSTPLVDKGYKVYKSTPYGPMEKVMPYLARRASENRSVMLGAREERIMLWNEFISRIRPF